jgi:hypothetical protein
MDSANSNLNSGSDGSSTAQTVKRLHADDARPARPPVRTQPVRLPQATAELIERLLAARCGTSA